MRSKTDAPAPSIIFNPKVVEGRVGSDESLIVAANLPAILLVEANTQLSDSRALLFASLGRRVHLVRKIADFSSPIMEKKYCLAAVGVHANKAILQAMLKVIRLLWPRTPILLLGESAIGVEDHQYDVIVNAAHHPADVIDVALRMISTWDRRRDD